MLKHKKILVPLCALCFLCLVVSNTKAQTPNATAPKYGGWVFKHPSKMGQYDHFNGGDKFPPTIMSNYEPFDKRNLNDNRYTVPAALQAKLVSLQSIFKAVCPQPFRHSICYNINPLTRIGKTASIPFQFNIGNYPFFYDAKGNLKPINPMSQLGNMYNGFCVVEINSYPNVEVTPSAYFYPFQKMHDYIKAIKDKDFYGIKTLNVITPFVNAMDNASATSNKLTPFNYQLPEVSKWPTVKWYTIVRRDNKKNFTEKVEETVVLTYNNQLPFITLTKLQFLELIEATINYRKEEVKKINKFVTIENNYKEKDIVAAQNRLKTIDDELELVQQIKKDNQSTINEKAIINPNYKSLLQYTYMITEFINNKNDKSTRAKKNILDFSDLFITDETSGYQLAYPDLNYYKNATDKDIKTITVKWNYVTRLAQHKNYGLSYEQEDINKNGSASHGYSDAPNSFMEGMLQRLDWKKLENLLTK